MWRCQAVFRSWLLGVYWWPEPWRSNAAEQSSDLDIWRPSFDQSLELSELYQGVFRPWQFGDCFNQSLEHAESTRAVLRPWHLDALFNQSLEGSDPCQAVLRPLTFGHMVSTKAWNKWPYQAVLKAWHVVSDFNQSLEQSDLCQAVFRP